MREDVCGKNFTYLLAVNISVSASGGCEVSFWTMHICENNSRVIRLNILKKLNLNKEWIINNQNIYYDEEKECYEIFVDETFKDNKAAYAVYCNKDSENNYYSRVEGEQTLQNATYQGILHDLN